MSRKIVIFAPFLTHPTISGPGTRLLNSASCLKQNGYDLHYAYLDLQGNPSEAMVEFWSGQITPFAYNHPSIHGSKAQRNRFRFRKWLPDGNYALKQNARLDDWFDLSIENQWKAYLSKIQPDTLICHYVWLSKVLEWTPPGFRTIIATHDRFSNRFEVAKKAKRLNDWYSTSPKEELRGLQRADCVIGISEGDHLFFQQTLGLHSVYHPPFTPIQKFNTTKESNLLFIGNKNASNVRAVEWFLENCWERLKKAVPNTQLLLVGNVCEAIKSHEGITKLGRVDDLSDAYSRCKISINPVPSGSGIAIKCLESLSYGLPVVATPEGARGLDDLGDDVVFKTSNPLEFTNRIIDLMTGPDKLEKSSATCSKKLQEWNALSQRNLLKAITPEEQ